jgi:hypothetical protein
MSYASRVEGSSSGIYPLGVGNTWFGDVFAGLVGGWITSNYRTTPSFGEYLVFAAILSLVWGWRSCDVHSRV